MLSHFRRFHADRSGNFSLIMAVLALPLTIGVGMALDVSAVQRSRSKLQAAADSAVLAIARQGVSISDTAARKIAEDMLGTNLGKPYSKLQVARVGTTFTVQAEIPADTSFGKLLGYGTWPVKALSSADIALMPYEIALVLDTTGSMRGGKLQSMKDAVAGLVDTMSANVKVKENLKFAVVPFSNFVNVGPQFAPQFDKKGKLVKGTGAEWLDLKGKSDVPQLEFAKNISRFEVFHNLGIEWAGCVETREPTKKFAYDVLDIAPGKKAESLFVPALSIDEPDDKDAKGNPIYANDYIASDVKPLDKTLTGKLKKLVKYGLAPLVADVGLLADSDQVVLGPSDAVVTPTKGPNASCVTKPIAPLSTDYQGVKDKVDGLVAAGNTNIMEGVAWGWRVLSPGEPFTEGAPKKAKTRKIMILLTDGSNVFGLTPDPRNELGSAYSSFGFSADERLVPATVATGGSTNTAMNDKTLAACTNAKQDGVEIFTIRLEEPNKTTGMMLKDCASAPDHFFDAPSRAQLDEVFGQIRDRITTIRLSS